VPRIIVKIKRPEITCGYNRISKNLCERFGVDSYEKLRSSLGDTAIKKTRMLYRVNERQLYEAVRTRVRVCRAVAKEKMSDYEWCVAKEVDKKILPSTPDDRIRQLYFREHYTYD